jgi:hypothetical protein
MRLRPALLIAAVLGIALAGPAAAQWKWRDGKGQVQYSDLPPPAGTAERDILQRPAGSMVRSTPSPAPAAASAASAPLLVPKGTEPELEAKRKKQEQDEADKRKAEEQRIAAAKAENCVRARSQLRTLESGVRIARTNDKGEREILDDKQLAAEQKRARDVMTSDCK